MLARAHGADALGLDGFVVTIEAASGAAGLRVIGQVDGALVDSARRVVAGLGSEGVEIGRVLVHVGPAERRKGSRGLDLALACAVLVVRGVVSARSLEGVLAFGEVGASGEIVACAGALSAAETAARQGFSTLVLPRGGVREASEVAGLELVVVDDLAGLIAHLREEARASPVVMMPRAVGVAGPGIVGVDSPLARLALEVMLAGGHHIAVHGAERSAVAAGLVGVPIELERDDAITLTKIHGLVQPTSLQTMPSVRRLARYAGLAGLLDELTLAHLGVLVIEDLHTLPAETITALRFAVDEHAVERECRRTSVRVPAHARLLVTIGDVPRRALALRAMLERFDLFVGMPCEEAAIVPNAATPERLANALARQRDRLRRVGWRWNADVPFTAGTRLLGSLDQDAVGLLAGMGKIEQHRVCRVAATLADLADQPTIDEHAVRLAIALRSAYRPQEGTRGERDEARERLATRVG